MANELEWPARPVLLVSCKSWHPSPLVFVFSAATSLSLVVNFAPCYVLSMASAEYLEK